MRTLTAYLIGVAIALTLLNGLAWELGGLPRLHGIAIFSGGFLMGALGMYIAATVYGYRQIR